MIIRMKQIRIVSVYTVSPLLGILNNKKLTKKYKLLFTGFKPELGILLSKTGPRQCHE